MSDKIQGFNPNVVEELRTAHDDDPYIRLPICGGGEEEAHIGDYIAPFGSCFRVYKKALFEDRVSPLPRLDLNFYFIGKFHPYLGWI